MPVTIPFDALAKFEEERIELYNTLQQKRQKIQHLTSILWQEQAKYDNLVCLMKSIQAFNICMVKQLQAKFKGVQANGTAYSWGTNIDPLPYFQSTLDILVDKVDGVSYLASMDIAGRIFDIFVEELSTVGEDKYLIKLVPREMKSTPVQSLAEDTWEHTIFSYVDKRLPQEVCGMFHCIDDVIAWVRAIKHPEIRITQEPYLGLPCVDTFSGLRITCDGRVNIASE